MKESINPFIEERERKREGREKVLVIRMVTKLDGDLTEIRMGKF